MRWSVVLVFALGCYQPVLHEGVPCAQPGMECPGDLVCDHGSCVRDPSAPGEAGVDNGVADPDALIDAAIIPVDAACGTCSSTTTFAPCMGAPVTCPLGCVSTGQHHCARIVPANNVPADLTAGTSALSISGIATFNTDSGAITGSITRPSGTGLMNGIAYSQVTSMNTPIGAFAFDALNVTTTGTVRFVGARAVVFLAEGAINVAGTIDLSGGCYGADRSCAGPGGSTGATMLGGTGACIGKNGATSATNNDDGGGGGGAGGESGGTGGNASPNTPGGSGGSACISTTLIPLQGGGGAGAGGTGQSMFPIGGGGGGAIQLTSQTAITVSGTINAGGAGGDGGNTAGGSSASAGSGGGGGGGILLEAPAVTTTGVIVANGGAGGGGGNSGIGPGTDGANGTLTTTGAPGGAGTASPGPGDGGDGGAGATAPTAGGDGTNSGGGGGGRGVTRVRRSSQTLGGTVSPPATTGALVTQ